MGMNEHEILQAQKHNKMVKGHGKFRYYTNRAFKDSRLKEKPVKISQPLKDLTEKYLHHDDDEYYMY